MSDKELIQNLGKFALDRLDGTLKAVRDSGLGVTDSICFLACDGMFESFNQIQKVRAEALAEGDESLTFPPNGTVIEWARLVLAMNQFREAFNKSGENE